MSHAWIAHVHCGILAPPRIRLLVASPVQLSKCARTCTVPRCRPAARRQLARTTSSSPTQSPAQLVAMQRPGARDAPHCRPWRVATAARRRRPSSRHRCVRRSLRKAYPPPGCRRPRGACACRQRSQYRAPVVPPRPPAAQGLWRRRPPAACLRRLRPAAMPRRPRRASCVTQHPMTPRASTRRTSGCSSGEWRGLFVGCVARARVRHRDGASLFVAANDREERCDLRLSGRLTA